MVRRKRSVGSNRRGKAVTVRRRRAAKPVRAKPVPEKSEAVAETAAAAAAAPVPKVAPFNTPRHIPTLEELFGGPRPVSFSRGLEPAFLLIDKDVMQHLRSRAMDLGLGGYDSLVKRILREHAHEY